MLLRSIPVHLPPQPDAREVPGVPGTRERADERADQRGGQRDAAGDLRRKPIGVEAVGTALRGRPSWDQFDDLTTMAVRAGSRRVKDMSMIVR